MSRRSQQIDALFRQGQQLHRTGRLAEAEQLYRQALSLAPRHAEALHALGALALQAGRPDMAETLLRQAVRLKPASGFQITLAAALTAAGRPGEAADMARRALHGTPGDAMGWQVLGHALSDSGRAAEAVAAYREARRLRPELPDICNNLGTALRQAGRLEEAEAVLRQAPAEPFALVNLSSVQKERGRFAEAEATLRRALGLSPNHPVLRYNWALLMLLLGRTDEAWDGWEQRFAAQAVPDRGLAQPQWRGEALNGRSLLVYAEQGLGDTIQFCRYLPKLPEPVVFEAPARLMRLLSGNPDMPSLVAAGGIPPRADVVVPLLSLPARTRVAPVAPPYLFAEANRIAVWRERIGREGTRVGIAWQGNSARHEDKGRSLPLACFAPLAEVPGLRLISLQRGEGEEQLAEAAFPVERLEGFDAGPDAFLDAAAVMTVIDLVVTSDTAIAHLAGALGRPVWLALRKVPDWRWMLDRADSPWYPTMRLFRQETDGDWQPVFRAMAEALRP